MHPIYRYQYQVGKRRKYLLQRKVGSEPVWQVPFHLDGIGPIPSSLKLSDSGQTPAPITHTHQTKEEI